MLLQYPFDSSYILQKKRSLKKQLLQKAELVEKKIAIVGGSTIGEFRNVLELFLLDIGIRPIFWEGEYGLFYENVVFDDGALASFAPDVLYIHTSNRNIRTWPTPANSLQDANDLLLNEMSRFKAVWQAASKLGCAVVQNNFEPPLWRNFGNMDASNPCGRVHFVNALNQQMAAWANENASFYIHDLAYKASLAGLNNWCDNSVWYAYKYACAVEYIPDFCHSLATLIGSFFGKTKKGIVCDLDNTLWGGVIGEVGKNGVEIGDETPTGMAFAEFQTYLKMLSQRGVLLNVASKNEDETAKEGFRQKSAPLNESDFLCFEANWGPKSESIASMAQTLNILPESLVFMDDNPAERELVTRELPAVVAPAVSQPENSIALIDRAGYFEVSSLSSDDINRREMYKQNETRQKLETNFGDYDDYLKSLCMKAEIIPFNNSHSARITQLINKTNQFNLTTRRYTDAEINALVDNPDFITISGQLTDKFGDNGITSVIITHVEKDTLTIDLWVMSCRVFKRHLEFAMFDELVKKAKEQGIKTINALWLKTAKNLLVKGFYATINFSAVAESEDEISFTYTVPENYENKNKVIEITGV